MVATYKQQSIYLYMAPIRGLTDSIYRQTFLKHFRGFNSILAPFINPQRKSLYLEKSLRDVLPENNPLQPPDQLIPQLLHTKPDDFLILASRLESLGYTHINWNLGCPAPMVTKKKRGSGFLPYRDEIIAFLDTVFGKLSVELSIKTRLGFTHPNELQTLLPLLDEYPIKEITIHARLGEQLYRGKADVTGFQQLLPLTKHDITYNGDITDVPSFLKISQQIPETNCFMIGRGAIANPFIAEEIKEIRTDSPNQKIKRLRGFHDDLFLQYQQHLSGPNHLLGRMKLIWSYWLQFFPKKKKEMKKLKKSQDLITYSDLVANVLET